VAGEEPHESRDGHGRTQESATRTLSDDDFAVGAAERYFFDHYLSQVASLASPGVDELRWPAPVRPGDSLRLRTEIVETRRSRSKPGRGMVRTRAELLNQHDQIVLSLMAMNLLRLRNP
jgi:acyl dehydratase